MDVIGNYIPCNYAEKTERVVNMRALVTGAAGFIGSHIVDRLIANGHAVVAIDNESATSNESFYWNENAEKVIKNICEYEQIEPFFKDVDCVFHLAAEAKIQPTIENPCLASLVNVVGTCNILQAARKNKVKKVVYSSTSAAYGLANQSPLREEMPNDCLNPYAVTKVAGEELCKMYTRLFNLPTVIFRYFNVYGERQPVRGQYAPVIGIFLHQFKNRESMTIVGDGLQRRDFVHVSDVVQANLLAAQSESPAINGEVFNVGNGKNYSILELAKIIGGPYKYIADREGESRITLADHGKITQLLGWKSTINVEDWIEEHK